MIRLGRRQFIVGASALGGTAAWFAGPAFGQTRSVSTTFGPTGIIYCASMVAIERGIAKEEGLDLKLVITDGGAKSRQVLAAAQTEYAHGDATHPLQISNRGKAAKILLATEVYASYSNIIVRKDLFDQGITSPEKFAAWKRPDGAKPIIAATAIGSGTWMFGSYIFEKLGLGDRLNWVSGGGSQTMLGALQSKQFDAIMALPAWQFEAEDRGWGRAIYDVTDVQVWNKIFGGPIPVATIYALETTVNNQPDVTQAYVNAVYRAMRWLKDAPIDEIYAVIGEKYIGGLNAEPVKREIAYYKKTWNYDGAISEETYKRAAPVWFRDGTDIKDTDYKTAVEPRFVANAKRKYG
jgi:NitT/TauT family transport system substrate-binding protein